MAFSPDPVRSRSGAVPGAAALGTVATPGWVTERSASLVRAARDLANELGDASFTVAQVAERAGASLKAFYRCFASKDDLLLALLADDSRIGAEILAERVAVATDGGRLRAFVDAVFAMVALPGATGYAGILVREYRRLAEHHADALDAALAPFTDLLAAQVDSDDPARDARTILRVLLDGISDVVLGRAADAAAHAAYVYAFCTHGVGAR